MSVIPQIVGTTLTYAGRTLHTVHQHESGASDALGRRRGPCDAPFLLRCYICPEMSVWPSPIGAEILLARGRLVYAAGTSPEDEHGCS